MKFVIHIAVLLCMSLQLHAQKDSLQAPYKRFPVAPPFQLLMGDSATKFTKAGLQKKKPLFFILFSPDCSHCQHTAEEMNKYKKELSGIQIVMATMQPLWQMNEFVKQYQLADFPNLIVGKDVHYLLPAFYGVKNLPYMAFYNKKGNLISVFEGGMPIPKVIQLFKDNK